MKRTLLLASLLLGLWFVARSAAIPAGADPAPDPAAEPITVVAHVDVLPPFTAAGRDLLREFAAASRQDPGATRIEVFEELGRPNHSTVVEVWASRRAYDDHLATAQTRGYRAKLQPMLGSPFDERLHRLMP